MDERRGSEDEQALRLVLPLQRTVGDGVVFLHPIHRITVTGSSAVLDTLLELCDGTRTRSEVVAKASERLGLPAQALAAEVDQLVDRGIVASPSTLWKVQQAAEANPSRFFPKREQGDIRRQLAERNIGQLGSRPRRSCRTFDSGEVLARTEIAAILARCYSYLTPPFASAGGLYPLSLSVARREAPPTSYEILHWNPRSCELVDVTTDVDPRALNFALNTSDQLFGAAVILIISVDFSIHSYKYGARGYRFSLIEVGQLAQAIVTDSLNMGRAHLEYGGFRDEALNRFLNLHGSSRAVLAMGLGTEVPAPHESPLDSRDRMLQRYCVPGGKYRPKFYEPRLIEPSGYAAKAQVCVAVADFIEEENHSAAYGAGAGPAVITAELVAIVEALERSAAGEVVVDVVAPATDLDCDWIDVRNVAPLSALALAGDGRLRPFDEDMPCEWRFGHRLLSGDRVAVPVDLINYPIDRIQLGRGLVALATSSGMSAHLSMERAVASARSELLERDSLMRLWWGCISPVAIEPDTLELRSAVLRWQETGGRLQFWYIEAMSGATVLATLRQGAYPAFLCGAANRASVHLAGLAALNELEGSAVAIAASKRMNAVPRDAIRLPEHHFAWYADPSNASHLEALFGGAIPSMDEEQLENWLVDIDESGVDSAIDPILVDMTPVGSELCVVRLISEALVPIWFGVDNHLGGHHRLSGADPRAMPWQPSVTPHFFP